MRYGALVEFAGALECFDLALIVQRFDERREAIRVQLSRDLPPSALRPTT
jgi:hypothetical protein